MNQEFQAIYEHGVLRLDKPLALPDQTRVAGVLNNIGEGRTVADESKHFSLDEFDRMLDELALDVPPLPADFSRADIYLDHD